MFEYVYDIGFFFMQIKILVNDLNNFWFFLLIFDIKLYCIYNFFKFVNCFREFEREENILWFRLSFFKDNFWFFSKFWGKKFKLFCEILRVVKYFRFLNKFLEIKLKLNWIFIVCNC